MTNRNQRVAFGAAVGLVVGGLAGALVTTILRETPALALPELQVHATATQGNDNFAIATGLVDDGVEALYSLDFTTGDLRAVVVSRRRPAFAASFRHNVAADLGTGGVKNPQYLMVTGQVDISRGSGASQVAASAVYVVEATTGQCAAYAVPWNSALHSAGKPQQGGMIKIDQASLRPALIRDEP
ncbi:hypothetical protein Mal64_30850 [Pseudobythopirellula maris]|uniref:Uncharacterized protein n=1 Tax=Pseudobythopirellula maris TaxID=2527991 RepID=A0A5C5ZJI3_9BACT|nr:hypothetical protein [Pseudobythopirellula maris]TWT87544.1 hypothetical protein Mal64_30850 [Pseudobythopirellula maris]